jgi:hypothetical protein
MEHFSGVSRKRRQGQENIMEKTPEKSLERLGHITMRK